MNSHGQEGGRREECAGEDDSGVIQGADAYCWERTREREDEDDDGLEFRGLRTLLDKTQGC